MPISGGRQEIFVSYATPLTSLRFSQQMGGMTSPGICDMPAVSIDGNSTVVFKPRYESSLRTSIDSHVGGWSVFAPSYDRRDP
jgi:hypothetical protein